MKYFDKTIKYDTNDPPQKVDEFIEQGAVKYGQVEFDFDFSYSGKREKLFYDVYVLDGEIEFFSNGYREGQLNISRSLADPKQLQNHLVEIKRDLKLKNLLNDKEIK